MIFRLKTSNENAGFYTTSEIPNLGVFLRSKIIARTRTIQVNKKLRLVWNTRELLLVNKFG